MCGVSKSGGLARRPLLVETSASPQYVAKASSWSGLPKAFSKSRSCRRNTPSKRVRRDKREGKSASTQAGEFVREEIEEIRAGKHGARSTKQAIAIGLSKARRAGVDLPAPKKGKTSERTRKSAQRAYERGHGAPPQNTSSAQR